MNIDDKIKELWITHTQKGLGDAQRNPLESRLKQVQAYCEATIENERFDLFLKLYDESTHFVYALYGLAKKSQKNSFNIESIPYILFLSRFCNLLITIRKLIIGGLEEPARIISRTALETMDIVLVTLMDKEFSLNLHDFISEEPQHNEDMDFWKNNIAYGKLNRKIELFLDICQMEPTLREHYHKQKKDLKNFFSKSVHSSMTVATDSLYIPSLIYSEMYEEAVLGGMGEDSPRHMVHWIIQLYYFSYLSLYFILSDSPPAIFEKSIVRQCEQELDTVFVSYFVVRDLYFEYTEQLYGEWK